MHKDYIDLSKLKREKIKKRTKIYRMDQDDWEGEYQKDIQSGHAILLDNPNLLTSQGDRITATENSLFDPKFQVPVDVDNNLIDYTCECMHIIGRFNEGNKCPVCNTMVEAKYSLELSKRGWIDLGEHKVIIPSAFAKIEQFIGPKKLRNILKKTSVVDADGSKMFIPSVNRANPFEGIGFLEFQERYLEILDYFRKTNNKQDLYNILVERKDITFTSKIYVMSSAYRPGYVSVRSKKSFNYHDINSSFVSILSDLKLLNKDKNDPDKLLHDIQFNLIDIYVTSMKKILYKNGITRANLISGRLFYSSRMVIISETEVDNIDATRISYKGFLGLFELEIINCMMRGIGNPKFAYMTYLEAKMYIQQAKYSQVIDEDLYHIMKELIEKREGGIWVLLNRPPSFDLGSLQMFQVVDVIRNCHEYIMTVPHNSLDEFKGDFDGDTLTAFSMKEKCVVDAFKEGFRPSKLIISRSGEYYNEKMNFIKDEAAFLRSFCDENFNPIDEGKLVDIEEVLSKITTPFVDKFDKEELGNYVSTKGHNEIDIINRIIEESNSKYHSKGTNEKDIFLDPSNLSCNEVDIFADHEFEHDPCDEVDLLKFHIENTK